MAILGKRYRSADIPAKGKKVNYYILEDGQIYTRQSHSQGGKRTFWERPQDVALSWINNRGGAAKYKKMVAEGRLVIKELILMY